jgi:S1-C subfamily serine protease
MKGARLLAVLVGCVALWSSAYAEQPEEILRAITKIRSTIPETARTASLLGTEREGSGVVIDAQGHILTIGYLILEAETIKIVGPDDKAITATFVGYDHNSGFGLVRTSLPLGVQPIQLGQSSAVNIGDPVLVASYGGPESARGVQVVSREEFAGYWEYLLEDAIFTTPPYSSFGGAALIDRDGQLVGIGSLFTQVGVPGVGAVPGNMFVPIDHLKPILEDMLATGRSSAPPKPWLGVFAEETHGRVFVTRVAADGPAEQAGLQPGDIILQVGQQDVEGLADFYRKVWALGGAGVAISLRILHGTFLRQVTVRSADRYHYLGMRPKR